MSRRPRDPFDPFFGNPDDDNDRDFFGDPFKHFEQMHKEIFRDFFGGDAPTIMIEHPNALNHRNGDQNAPDLSAINPNAPKNPNAPRSNNNNNNQYRRNDSHPFAKIFEHFFEPEYDNYKLSDINPNLSDNGPIHSKESDDKGLIHSDGAPPGFRSPYMPNWNGAEKEMEFGHGGPPKTFFRSQSVIISTGPDGKRTKTTTIRDSNGETTTTEELDGNDHGMNGFNDGIRSIFNWNDHKIGNDNQNNEPIELFGKKQAFDFPTFVTTNDPLKKIRDKWQNWRWNPYNWNKDETQGSGGYHLNEGKKEGIQWKSYKDYRSENKKSSLLDDIVKDDKK